MEAATASQLGRILEPEAVNSFFLSLFIQNISYFNKVVVELNVSIPEEHKYVHVLSKFVITDRVEREDSIPNYATFLIDWRIYTKIML